MRTAGKADFHAPLFLTALLVSVIGLVNLYSATAGYREAASGDFFTSQLVHHALGLALMFCLTFLPVTALWRFAAPSYFASLVLLGLVLVAGSEANGSLSWLVIGPLRLQPSEFAKPALVLMLSRHLAGITHRHPLDAGGLLGPLLITLAPLLLVLLQKDAGTALFFGLIFLSLVLLRGVKIGLVLVGAALAVGLLFASYHYLMAPYQQRRVMSFMNPEADPRGAGYHIVQAKIAVGSGGFLGRGYLKGESNKLKYLPERHTDFVFPVLAEEWGFAGAAVALSAYLLFLLYGIAVAARAPGRFGFFSGMGMTALFFGHLAVNLGGVLGLLPLTGVPLPFFSYGGSSLVSSWIAVGVVLNLYRNRMAVTGGIGA